MAGGGDFVFMRGKFAGKPGGEASLEFLPDEAKILGIRWHFSSVGAGWPVAFGNSRLAGGKVFARMERVRL